MLLYVVSVCTLCRNFVAQRPVKPLATCKRTPQLPTLFDNNIGSCCVRLHLALRFVIVRYCSMKQKRSILETSFLNHLRMRLPFNFIFFSTFVHVDKNSDFIRLSIFPFFILKLDVSKSSITNISILRAFASQSKFLGVRRQSNMSGFWPCLRAKSCCKRCRILRV